MTTSMFAMAFAEDLDQVWRFNFNMSIATREGK